MLIIRTQMLGVYINTTRQMNKEMESLAHQSNATTDIEVVVPTIAVRKYKFKSGTRSIRQIRKLQKGTDLLIQRAPFKRLVQETTQMFNFSMYYKKNAITALHEACEAYLVERFQNGIDNTVRCGRTTLLVQDMQTSGSANHNMM